MSSHSLCLTDPKCRKNAITTDWPGYLTKCPNTLLINRHSQMILNKHATLDFKQNPKDHDHHAKSEQRLPQA